MNYNKKGSQMRSFFYVILSVSKYKTYCVGIELYELHQRD